MLIYNYFKVISNEIYFLLYDLLLNDLAEQIEKKAVAKHQNVKNNSFHLIIQDMATENLAPQVISRLMGEIRNLVKHPSDGIEYVDNDENSVSEIHAIITGPGKLREESSVDTDLNRSCVY